MISIGTGLRSTVSKQSLSSVKISPACSSIFTPSNVIDEAGDAPNVAATIAAANTAPAAANDRVRTLRHVALSFLGRLGREGSRRVTSRPRKLLVTKAGINALGNVFVLSDEGESRPAPSTQRHRRPTL